MTAVERFLAMNPPAIDYVREEAARCAEETAKHERGERGPIRDLISHGPLLAEFSDGAFGVAGELATVVAEVLYSHNVKFGVAQAWDLVAQLLRSGWKRGDRLEGHVIGKAARA